MRLPSRILSEWGQRISGGGRKNLHIPPQPFTAGSNAQHLITTAKCRASEKIQTAAVSFRPQRPLHGSVWGSVLRHGGAESLPDRHAREEHHRPGDGLPHCGLPDTMRDSISKRWAAKLQSVCVLFLVFVGGFLLFVVRILPCSLFHSRFPGTVWCGGPAGEGFSCNRSRTDRVIS